MSSHQKGRGDWPIIVEVGVGGNVSLYPGMTYANFVVIPHYVDGFGRYGEGLITVNGRPDGEGEYIWPACNNKQGFEWFASATLAKRGKGATDLRPYTLLSAWASVVPGVRSTDFTPEEGGHPIYAASTSDGAQVVQWTANSGTNQQWQFVPA